MIGDTSETVDRFHYFTDSHCHVKSVTSTTNTADDDDNKNTKNNNNTSSFPCGIKSAVVCGTHPDKDWSLIERLAAVKEGNVHVYPTTTLELSSPVIIPGFGIHPWFVPYKQEEKKEEEEKEEEDHTIGEKEKRSMNTNNNNNNNSDDTNDPRGEDVNSFSCCCGSTTAADNGNSNIFSTSNSSKHPSTLQQQQEKEKKEEKERTSEELLSLLEDKLHRYPHAIVGEIGLDKLRGPPPSVQRNLFIAQMRLAAQYNRPVSVHCVRSFGTMLETLRELPAEFTPPAIVMHGFTGTIEFAKSVMSIRKKPSQMQSLTMFSSSSISISNSISNSSSGIGGRSTRKSEPLRVFFGVGATTSLRVKGFASHTLPFLLQQRRVMLETDAHHTLMKCHSSELLYPSISTTSTTSMGIVKREEKEKEKEGKEITEKKEGMSEVLLTSSKTAVSGVERLVWDSAGCGQLKELHEIVNNATATMEEKLRNGCEEAFTEVFGPFFNKKGREEEKEEKGE